MSAYILYIKDAYTHSYIDVWSTAVLVHSLSQAGSAKKGLPGASSVAASASNFLTHFRGHGEHWDNSEEAEELLVWHQAPAGKTARERQGRGTDPCHQAQG